MKKKKRYVKKNRNSYYKTDYSATAMVLKEDYYFKTSHDFHAGYNVQIMVSSYFIVMYGVFQDRDDYNTLIPMINLYYKCYGNYPISLCADSGYGNYSNYKYLKEHKIANYVKLSTWSSEASGKRLQLFKVDSNNKVICLN